MARRFINLVDEFYDRSVKLIISAEVELKDLCGGRLEFEFQRTLSRLLEMQSHEYLTRPHRPLIRGGNERLPMATLFMDARRFSAARCSARSRRGASSHGPLRGLPWR